MTHNAESLYPLHEYCARRFVHFYELLCQIYTVPGDIVECGVATGETLFYQAVITRMFEQDRYIYGFDSFRGLSRPGREDEPERSESEVCEGRFSYSKEYVAQRLLANGIDREFFHSRICLIEGWLSDTLNEYQGSGIAFLHLDVDLYEPYKQALESLYPKVNPGGIIAFDEYRDPLWVGATKAIDEFFGNKEEIHSSHVLPDKYYVIREA